MSSDEMEKYKGTAEVGVNELKTLPDQVVEQLEAHRQLYLTDPEAAHYWDPIIIGIPGGPVSCLLLEYMGRKSGKQLNMAIQYFRLGGKVAIVASKGGIEDHPIWYLNLLADPKCKVHIGAKSSDAVARTAQGEERAKWWSFITKEQPMQSTYEARTSREIPVVVLDFPEGADI